jgi:hypothetical protein
MQKASHTLSILDLSSPIIGYLEWVFIVVLNQSNNSNKLNNKDLTV